MSLGLKNLQSKCKLTDNQGKAEQVPSRQCVWKPVVLSERLSAQEQGKCCLQYGGGHRGWWGAYGSLESWSNIQNFILLGIVPTAVEGLLDLTARPSSLKNCITGKLWHLEEGPRHREILGEPGYWIVSNLSWNVTVKHFTACINSASFMWNSNG